jgi:hypothetical protein
MKVYVEHGGKDPSILNLGIPVPRIGSLWAAGQFQTVVMKRKLQSTLPVIET